MRAFICPYVCIIDYKRMENVAKSFDRLFTEYIESNTFVRFYYNAQLIKMNNMVENGAKLSGTVQRLWIDRVSNIVRVPPKSDNPIDLIEWCMEENSISFTKRMGSSPDITEYIVQLTSSVRVGFRLVSFSHFVVLHSECGYLYKLMKSASNRFAFPIIFSLCFVSPALTGAAPASLAGLPSDTLPIIAQFLPIQDIGAFSESCRSIESSISGDSQLWRNIHDQIDRYATCRTSHHRTAGPEGGWRSAVRLAVGRREERRMDRFAQGSTEWGGGPWLTVPNEAPITRRQRRRFLFEDVNL
jgi:hypothetical protein